MDIITRFLDLDSFYPLITHKSKGSFFLSSLIYFLNSRVGIAPTQDWSSNFKVEHTTDGKVTSKIIHLDQFNNKKIDVTIK